jgi:hypothetical protein
VIEKTVLENNDDCHREAVGVGNKQFQRYFKTRSWEGFIVCDAEGPRPLTRADIDKLAA